MSQQPNNIGARSVQFSMTPPVLDHCAGCPLRNSPHVRQQVTTEVHSCAVDVLFITDSPGDLENQVGRPFLNHSGSILRRIVKQLTHGDELKIAYGNAVRCRSIDNSSGSVHDRPPTDQEAACCKANILADIQLIKPRYLVLCGKVAVTALALDPDTRERVKRDLSITAVRGSDFIVKTPDGTEYPATATYHPSYVARNAVSGSVFREDICRALLRAKQIIPDYSKRGSRVELLDTVDKVRDFLKHLVRDLSKQDIVAMDYETGPSGRIGSRLLTISFAYGVDQGSAIPYRHPQSPWDAQEFKEVRQLLIKFFTTTRVSFGALVAHNLKFEAAVTLDEFGVYLDAFPLEDTMLRAHAINENRKAALHQAFGLKILSDEWLGFTGYRDPDILPVVELVQQNRSAEVDLLPLCEYNAIDCYVTVRLYRMQDSVAAQENYTAQLKRLGVLMHGPVSIFASQMERNGIRANTKQLKFLMTPASPIFIRQRAIEQELYALPSVQKANHLLLTQNKKVENMVGVWGTKKREPWLFHINRQASKEALYIQQLELTAGETAKGNPSIDKKFYDKYKGVVEVDLLAEWTELDKLRGTYIEGIYKLIQQHPDMRDGRVRAQFNFHTTATSRTSSERPNMQNIPKGKTASAKAIKSLYMVDPGHLMVCADYSQAEVRWLAEITKDQNLLRAFLVTAQVKREYDLNPTPENAKRLTFEGDFHYQTAAQIFGKKPSEVTKDERNRTKAIVFGLIYGMSSYGLAARLNIDQDEAEKYQEMFLSQFPQARDWLGWIEQEGFREGFITSPIGRRRHLVSNYLLENANDLYHPAYANKQPSYYGNQYPNQSKLTDLGKYKQYEDRVCRNAPIQSIASDTNLMACINIQRYILANQLNWRLINIVHDSIMAEIPFREVGQYIEVANKIMTSPEIFKDFGITLTVPFRADFTVGLDWGHQFDLVVMEECELVCRQCAVKRPVSRPVQNRRCEGCGSTEVDTQLVSGPLSTVLNYLEKRYPDVASTAR
jgi:uracil-DNA glycosylase family 4